MSTLMPRQVVSWKHSKVRFVSVVFDPSEFSVVLVSFTYLQPVFEAPPVTVSISKLVKVRMLIPPLQLTQHPCVVGPGLPSPVGSLICSHQLR